MSELSEKNFGIVIAYVVPGFVALWGISHLSPTVDSWITTSQHGAPTIAGFLYVTLASLTAGLTVSAVRWAIVDSLHHATGVKPPSWDFVNLDDRLQGFLALVENHYRYYQFYANMLVSGAAAYSTQVVLRGNFCQANWSTVGFILLGSVFLAGSRDALQKYYSRVERLLGTPEAPERSVNHDKRFPSPQGALRKEHGEEAEALETGCCPRAS